MEAAGTFNQMDRKQAFIGLLQEVILEPSKQDTDLESYLDELVEYLQPQMDEILRGNGRGFQLCWSVQVKSSTPLMNTVDYDADENWFRCGHDEYDDPDEDAETTVIYTRAYSRSRMEISRWRGWKRRGR